MTPFMLTIAGTTPLLCGRPASDTIIDGDDRSHAAARLYLGADGVPVIPSLNCHRCFVSAARYLGTSAAELVHALGIVEREIPIRSAKPWTVDSRFVRHPTTGERRLCHRPRFDNWRLDLTVLLDLDMVPETAVRQLVEAAGIRIGLGDYRPERNGPFGRFRVATWSPSIRTTTTTPNLGKENHHADAHR